jgi:hypothetical protein
MPPDELMYEKDSFALSTQAQPPDALTVRQPEAA